MTAMKRGPTEAQIDDALARAKAGDHLRHTRHFFTPPEPPSGVRLRMVDGPGDVSEPKASYTAAQAPETGVEADRLRGTYGEHALPGGIMCSARLA